jgi:histidyl-tRNA synthetase
VTKFSTLRGTADILPEDWPYWDFVLGKVQHIASIYGYRRIETPTLADTALFTRSVGAGTDIVDKEMYTFHDRGGDELTLRAEGTAPVVRAYLQHGMHTLPQPVKLYYVERVYRRENPQHGRLREHHQFGCEAIGLEDPYLDVEVIALLDQFYRSLGLVGLALHINSIGDAQCRPQYVQALVNYLRERESWLAEQDRERLLRNPLRVLDSKEARSQEVVEGAPSILQYLCADCRAHWDEVLTGLEALDISYQPDHRLVRGLDYYTRTVFEFMPPREGAQSVIGSGGRYDGLAQVLGGPHTPGVGFGSGIERIILNMKERGAEVPQPPGAEVYVVHAGPGTEREAFVIAQGLRHANVRTDFAFGERSLKAQMRHAGAAGARYAVIVGEDELKDGVVTLRDLTTGEQRRVSPDELREVLAPGGS